MSAMDWLWARRMQPLLQTEAAECGLAALGLNGLFAFSIVPLRIAVVLGALAIALAGGFGAYALYAKLVLQRRRLWEVLLDPVLRAIGR